MLKTRRFQHGRFNYYIDYRQFAMPVVDSDTGKTTMELMHREYVKFFEFPFSFGESTQFGICKDVGEYYRS